MYHACVSTNNRYHISKNMNIKCQLAITLAHLTNLFQKVIHKQLTMQHTLAYIWCENNSCVILPIHGKALNTANSVFLMQFQLFFLSILSYQKELTLVFSDMISPAETEYNSNTNPTGKNIKQESICHNCKYEFICVQNPKTSFYCPYINIAHIHYRENMVRNYCNNGTYAGKKYTVFYLCKNDNYNGYLPWVYLHWSYLSQEHPVNEMYG